MKHIILAIALVFLSVTTAVVATSAPAAALCTPPGCMPDPCEHAICESHIAFDNTSDAWVWVTAYSTRTATNLGAWCVKPHSFDRHGLRAPTYEVRAEIKRGSCSAANVMDARRGFPHHGLISRMTYVVSGSGGSYHFTNI